MGKPEGIPSRSSYKAPFPYNGTHAPERGVSRAPSCSSAAGSHPSSPPLSSAAELGQLLASGGEFLQGGTCTPGSERSRRWKAKLVPSHPFPLLRNDPCC